MNNELLLYLQNQNDKLKKTLKAYQKITNPLVGRWNSTKVWHNPEFRDGIIKITTGDLADLAKAKKLANETTEH